MIQVKCLLVGGVMGILSTLAGLAVAKADCGRDGGFDVYPSAVAQSAADDCSTNYGEIMSDNGDEAMVWCVPDSVAEGCLEVTSQLDCSLQADDEECDQTMGVMFDACLRLVFSGLARFEQ